MNLENGGVALAPTKKYFPITIYRAMESALLSSDLPAKLRATMSALAAYADRHQPTKPITVEQETLAERLGRSSKTISRHLDDLVALGWIEKSEQRRRGRTGRFNSGRFAGCIFVLTAQTISALGLAPSLTKEKDKMSDGYTGSELTSTNRQPAQRIKSGLPTDLSWLAERMDTPGIFALMKKATQHGKRLSDISAVVRPHLEKRGLQGRRLFAYLAKLATGERCFQVDAQRQKAAELEVENAKVLTTEANEFRAQYAGKLLKSTDGRTTIFVERNGQSALVEKDGEQRTLPLFSDVDLAKLRNAVKTGQFSLAS